MRPRPAALNQGGGDDDLAAYREALDPRRGVDRPPNDPVLRPLRGSNVADHHLSGVQRDSHLDRGPTPLQILFIHAPHRLLHPQGAEDRPLGIILQGHRGAKKHQDGVPDDLIDRSTVPLDHFNHGREIMVQQGNHLRGLQPLGQGGEAPQIGHQDRNLPFLSAELEPVGRVQERLHDFVARVAAKDLPDELVATLQLLVGILELLGHAIEGNGEVPHEINPLLQVSPGDLLGLLGEVPKIRLECL